MSDNPFSEASISRYAQFIADHIDTTIFLKHVRQISMEEAHAAADDYLATEGWDGRKYPKGFFTIASVFKLD